MKDKEKTKKQLIHELEQMRRRIAKLETFKIERKRAEEALRESEEKYRALFEDSRDAVYITTRDGRHVDANESFLSLFGYTREEITKLTAREMYANGHDRRKFQRQIEQEGSVRDYEVKLYTKDGTELDCLITATVRSDGGGSILGYQGIIRDITKRKRAEEALRQSHDKLRRTFEETVNVLASAVEMRDPYTAGHQRRVTKLVCAIAKEIGFPEEQREGLRLAATIHDIGKIYVPAEILSKPSQLGKIEYDLIKHHPEVGYEILNGIEFPWPVAEIVLQHHERLDGSGYPHGISGDAIIREARILALADVVEAMASHRPYRAARGTGDALEEISRYKNILYDAEVVDACLRIFYYEAFKFE